MSKLRGAVSLSLLAFYFLKVSGLLSEPVSLLLGFYFNFALTVPPFPNSVHLCSVSPSWDAISEFTAWGALHTRHSGPRYAEAEERNDQIFLPVSSTLRQCG